MTDKDCGNGAARNAQLLVDIEFELARSYSQRHVNQAVRLLSDAKTEIERLNMCMHVLRCEATRLTRQISEWQGDEIEVVKKVRLVEP